MPTKMIITTAEQKENQKIYIHICINIYNMIPSDPTGSLDDCKRGFFKEILNLSFIWKNGRNIGFY